MCTHQKLKYYIVDVIVPGIEQIGILQTASTKREAIKRVKDKLKFKAQISNDKAE